MKIEGGCHCELVRWEAKLPEGPVEVLDCDCSICRMTGYLHVIVAESDFTLVEGKKEITTYRFGSGKARHIFCSQCGIKSYYKPRSHPDGISLNLRCIDDAETLETRVVAFDGKNHPGAIA
ncbi:GFA family protein [Sphingomonas sp. BIUV-7]|uniref:GFA family protein n=1 Tax=Sphingomonas natans TaxID=3063330 RepID=A0ABT8Y6N1_9SPHN|nr:GFA family protein [Sphingomonas sp. BIUV-7]MDO6413384.1 GFA family protein [Sphingomonas sp. BIUV-7]